MYSAIKHRSNQEFNKKLFVVSSLGNWYFGVLFLLGTIRTNKWKRWKNRLY